MRLGLTLLAGSLIAIAGCQRGPDKTPAPFAMTEDAMGRYCGMNILEHPGPKGQVILAKYDEPIWFSSARDTIAFTMLPEEPKDIRAIYVSDMAKAPNWDNPGINNWVNAKDAFFVIGSDRKGGMGTAEAVPFSSSESARAFANEHGGQVLDFADLPRGYVLGQESETASYGSSGPQSLDPDNAN
ncbi:MULTISPECIES: nitrous oxide reductase accessory protein NosL [unclassified Mesorhizobium]|uniref:nitrous oxide reductase accessory protein NosL n=1 Tax=unclassified Mesorhizobium TaxID=325217 RepID=UPI001093B369|nr:MULTISPECIES: nitrous oxide reductase accessory protein NosL [unclassified Mesorhizobium]TGQ72945.1 copper resistance protein CopZ [bacterium M00.F.Ca.ET.205.01.1.1]TGU54120.1 copper resistance protein CopZ [bacterium M00.F.Ca.ET.152.01.1.1]TGV37200.1 copper resistance protein CopZ [Mesorhizobium sp. M00.F.Ca.ET.186.01.1.1]TGZ39431.1 copper resistance protein CopZ [bacterium M00.F.Ca.ET.162.01.1.1]TGT92112.1 copper resistance protein CopZ [Mesorhizobium sp. M8A.F.Ca.ET.161.01.1.1]